MTTRRGCQVTLWPARWNPPSLERVLKAGFIGSVVAAASSALAVAGWEGETFRPLAYHNDYVPLGPTPQAVCAAYAAVWHWNTNGFSASAILTSGGWSCQRYYNGAPQPGWSTPIRAMQQTGAAAPVQTGAHWSQALYDPANDLFHCETGKRFDRSIQWCVPGSSSSGTYSPDWDRSCPSPNPVQPASGNKIALEVDYSSGDLTGLQRRYSYRANSSTTELLVGPAWRLRLGTTLELVGVGPIHVKTWSPEGRVTIFEKDQAGRWVATSGTRDRLIELFAGTARTGWLFYDLARNALDTFAPDGRLLASWRIGGARVSLDYSDDSTPTATAPWIGTVVRATSNFGRSINFVSSLAGVTQVVIPGAQADGAPGTAASPIRYAYGESGSLGPGVKSAGQLTSVSYPDGSFRRYHYEDARFPLALGGITDNGVRLSRYLYDGEGRVTSTVWYSSPTVTVNQWLFAYPAAGQTLVVDPRGATNNVTAINLNGVNLQTGSSQPEGAGCAAATSNQQFDSSGSVVQRDDFNGNRSCMAYDAIRNLESSRLEGLQSSASCADLLSPGAALPAGSRRVSTQWHPEWNLPVRVALPKRLSTRVYNGQPDPLDGNATAICAPPDTLLPDGRPIVVLCKEVEQATTDETGALGFEASLDTTANVRIRAFTYNSDGQIITSTDPRGSTNTYSYYGSTTADYTRGDLQQHQNPLNQVTQFSHYSAHGQPLRSIDPNGVVTDYSYDLRQRLKSVSVAGQATVFDYWPNGLTRSVTLPDASHVTYEYDDAQRLRSISDNLGNRIEYMLDSFGTRTVEQVKDPFGLLRRQITRTPDALGRIQQVTGRE